MKIGPVPDLQELPYNSDDLSTLPFMHLHPWFSGFWQFQGTIRKVLQDTYREQFRKCRNFMMVTISSTAKILYLVVGQINNTETLLYTMCNVNIIVPT